MLIFQKMKYLWQIMKQRIFFFFIPGHFQSGSNNSSSYRFLQCKWTVINNSPTVIKENGLVVAEMDFIEYKMIFIMPDILQMSRIKTPGGFEILPVRNYSYFTHIS